ncbi:hypothetical protein LTR95_006927 [Oleoguttula sp. CCFEE 5521]
MTCSSAGQMADLAFPGELAEFCVVRSVKLWRCFDTFSLDYHVRHVYYLYRHPTTHPNYPQGIVIWELIASRGICCGMEAINLNETEVAVRQNAARSARQFAERNGHARYRTYRSRLKIAHHTRLRSSVKTAFTMLLCILESSFRIPMARATFAQAATVTAAAVNRPWPISTRKERTSPPSNKPMTCFALM